MVFGNQIIVQLDGELVHVCNHLLFIWKHACVCLYNCVSIISTLKKKTVLFILPSTSSLLEDAVPTVRAR